MTQKPRRVKMLVSWAGETFGYQADQEAELPEELAIALCTEPADAPRAVPVGWEVDEARGVAKVVDKRPPAPAAEKKTGGRGKAAERQTRTTQPDESREAPTEPKLADVLAGGQEVAPADFGDDELD
ncbi:MAG TPA: hypothetical protein VG265_07355 [Gaiellaceae bacterium]|jgi:hypothetical protein|nr:hypothetical protein [Gaiellaceae bacterium]